ncbi:MAG: KEOPS complex subunit Pcc1 [Candidatus Bathyarchaeales archaeon]
MEAEITLKYGDAKTAEAIAKAVSPDNFKTPSGLFIETTRKANKVLTKIRCEGKMATFIATIDDLLFCVSTAEKILRTTRILSGESEGT